MIKRLSRPMFVVIVLGMIASCSFIKSHNETSNITNIALITPHQSGANESSSVEDVASLCEKLDELKKIPYSYGEVADDPIYDGLVSKDIKAIPCLVDKITDTKLMDDPRTAPHVGDFRVGDAAIFMLLMITKEEWQPETMLSPEYAKLWKTEGVYAYFAYVEKPANRKKIQLWWKNWMKENLDK